jgi:hypothetical protein
VWPEYRDQDQDKGWGICQDCQHLNAQAEAKELASGRALIREALNEANRAQWDTFDEALQNALVLDAINDQRKPRHERTNYGSAQARLVGLPALLWRVARDKNNPASCWCLVCGA